MPEVCLHRRRTLDKTVALALVLCATAAFAVTSATFVFDTVSDPGDLADGPDYDVTGVAPVDDTGAGCDAVVMLMVDATGTPTDVDSFCLSTSTGLGGSDGDYGSFETGYVPTIGPVTYSLFDIDAADLAALTGFGDSDREFFDYVLANGTCLAEAAFPVDGIPNGGAFPLCAGGAVTAIPTLDTVGLSAMAGLLALGALWVVRRRAASRAGV
jgi:MYXO-CTERM domain-containing protein